MKPAAIYARVSTTDQADEGTSLTTQLEACRTYAHKHGYAVIHEASDDISGSTLARPGLDSVRNLADARQIEAILFYKLDRLARDTGDTLMLLKEFRERGVELVSVTVKLEDSPEGKFLLTMLAAVAEFERSQISERTRRGKERRAREGKVMTSWAQPYGYRYVPGEGRFEVIPEEAAWVKQIFRWFLEDGLPVRGIATRLNTQNVRTKKNKGTARWYGSTVRSILFSETYAGQWYWNKKKGAAPKRRKQQDGKAPEPRSHPTSYVMRPREEWVPIEVQAIIPAEWHEQAVARLQRNKELSARNTRRRYLLSGLLFCGYCGWRLGGGVGNKYIRRYYCLKRQTLNIECPLSEMRAEWIEELVWDELMEIYGTRERILAAFLAYDQQNTGKPDVSTLELARLERETATVLRERDRLLDLYVTEPPQIDRATLEGRLGKLREREDKAQKAQTELTIKTQQDARKSIDIEAVMSQLTILQEGLNLVSWEGKRAFMRAVDLRIMVYTDRLVGVLQGGLLPGFDVPASLVRKPRPRRKLA